MSTGIMVLGPTGSGKTTACRNFDPKSTFYINVDNKPLPWRGWKKQYISFDTDTCKGNLVTFDVNNQPIMQLTKWIEFVGSDKRMAHFKRVIVDTVNTALLGVELSNWFRGKSGKGSGSAARDKWYDLASEGWDLFIKTNSMRDDLFVYVLGHTNTPTDSDTMTFRKMITNGRKLEKLQPESLYSVVLHCMKQEAGDGIEYLMELESAYSTAKVPMGAIKASTMGNDLSKFEEQFRKYEEGE